jgi:hypothetical protein
MDNRLSELGSEVWLCLECFLDRRIHCRCLFATKGTSGIEQQPGRPKSRQMYPVGLISLRPAKIPI